MRFISPNFIKLIPNFITYGRLALTPVIAFMMIFDSDTMRWLTLAAYTFACISDYLDGFIARRMASLSTLGRVLDPIADKLLVSVILMMLVLVDTINSWQIIPALIILAREIFVSGLREFLIELRVSLPVTYLAKWKTVVQLVALGFLIVSETGETVLHGSLTIGYFLLWAAAGLTVYTGYDYIRAGMKHFSEVTHPEQEDQNGH